MIKELVKDEAALAIPGEPATAEDAEVVQDLLDTIESMEDCACLAANMIGSAKRIIVYRDDNEVAHVMLNPRIKMAGGAYKAVEACLSLEKETQVTRYQRAKIMFDELVDGKLVARQKEFLGWTAEIIQHGIDHCNGKLV